MRFWSVVKALKVIRSRNVSFAKSYWSFLAMSKCRTVLFTFFSSLHTNTKKNHFHSQSFSAGSQKWCLVTSTGSVFSPIANSWINFLHDLTSPPHFRVDHQTHWRKIITNDDNQCCVYLLQKLFTLAVAICVLLHTSWAGDDQQIKLEDIEQDTLKNEEGGETDQIQKELLQPTQHIELNYSNDPQDVFVTPQPRYNHKGKIWRKKLDTAWSVVNL